MSGRQSHIAVFDATGELVDQGAWPFDKLSDRWLRIAREMLEAHPPSGVVAIPVENLDHIAVKVTRAQGSAIVAYHARGQLATSALLLGGANVDADSEIQRLFLESVKRAPTASEDAFSALETLTSRPLQAVAIWGNPNVSEDDYHLLRDFSLHLAGAFFGEA